MNLDNDYDNDGNNIVPCPICLSNYCPSKEDGKCPEEDMFALEGEIRMLLDEYKATDDNSRITNVLEAVEKLIHQELQKAREEAQERCKFIIKEQIKALQDRNLGHNYYLEGLKMAVHLIYLDQTEGFEEPDQSELDQPTV